MSKRILILSMALALLSGCISSKKGDVVSLKEIESFDDLVGIYQAKGTNHRDLTHNLFWQQNVRTPERPTTIKFVEKEDEIWVQGLQGSRLIAEYPLSTKFEVKNGMIPLWSSGKSRATLGGHEKNDPGAMMPIPTPPMAARSSQKVFLTLTVEGNLCVIEKNSGAGVILFVPMVASTKETSTFTRLEPVDQGGIVNDEAAPHRD